MNSHACAKDKQGRGQLINIQDSTGKIEVTRGAENNNPETSKK